MELNTNKISIIEKKLILGEKVNVISQMISDKETIIVGLSGGADSVALTYFLTRISAKYHLKIIGCHINHGIRGKEADKDQEFVERYCNQLNIDLLEKKEDILALSKLKGTSIEELGREVRYNFFKECAKLYNAKIATAHNLNDNLETVILNLVRGTALKGLCGIPSIRDNIIRPFIIFSREEIEKYCRDNHLSFIIDSSNLTLDYSRNIIRHKVIPVLLQINPNFLLTVKRNCDILFNENKYLDEITQKVLNNISSEKGFSIKQLARYDIAIKTRVIKKILSLNKIKFSCDKINQIINFVFKNKISKLSLNSIYYISKKDNIFKIASKTRENYEFPLKLNLFENKSKKYIKYDLIKYEDLKDKLLKDKQLLKRSIDYDKIIGNPILRHKQNGDKIKLKYRKVTKSLKKLFNEENLSKEEKLKILVISDEKGVIWVEGFGADERVNISNQTKTVLFFSI